ncbi:hypothetical protein IIB51_02170 [Patescibacteria group bacterium]|nr:hypothetical protein [Patescibacteria group bacterium]
MDQNNKGNQEVDLDSTPEDYGPGVRFEEEWQSPVQTLSPETPKMIQWVIEYSGGYVKDENHANYVLIGFVILIVIISLFLVFRGENEQNTFIPSAEAPVTEVIPPADF